MEQFKDLPLPKCVEWILHTLEIKGFEAYIIGGCVRDMLLSLQIQGNFTKQIKDFDICTNATPQQMIEVFKPYHLIPTGLKHGTMSLALHKKHIKKIESSFASSGYSLLKKLLCNELNAESKRLKIILDFLLERQEKQSEYILFEITTFRSDGKYSNNRSPDGVEFVSDLQSDVKRRDFTINAIAYNKKIIDYVGGLEHLRDKKIACVGEAELRFSEDALRILRALRFAATIGFSIESSTREAIFKCKNLLKNISFERIKIEFDKLLCGKYASEILSEYREIISEIIFELKPTFNFNQHNKYHHLDVWEHTLLAIKHSPKLAILRWVALLHDIGKPSTFSLDSDGVGHFYTHALISRQIAQSILNRLKFDNKSKKIILELIFYHNDFINENKRNVLKRLNKIGLELFILLLAFQKADALAQNPQFASEKLEHLRKLHTLLDEVVESKSAFSLKDLAINGHHLHNMGFCGKEIGQILQLLLKKVMDNELQNDEKLLLQAASELKKSIESTKA